MAKGRNVYRQIKILPSVLVLSHKQAHNSSTKFNRGQRRNLINLTFLRKLKHENNASLPATPSRHKYAFKWSITRPIFPAEPLFR